MDWKYISYTSGIVMIFLFIIFIIYFLYNLRVYKQNRKNWQAMQDSIETGKMIVFNGIYGKVLKMAEDYLEVEISKDIKVKITKYSVNKVLE